MAAGTFGRKGIGSRELPPGRAAFAGPPRSFVPQRPAAPAAEEADSDLARRRAAFIAAERARASDPEASAERPPRAPAHAIPVVVREKSIGAAYALWACFAGLGAHRFYLGFPISGAIQASCWLVSWMMILAGFLGAFVGLLGCALWFLVDGFLIVGLHERANRRSREAAVADAFL